MTGKHERRNKKRPTEKTLLQSEKKLMSVSLTFGNSDIENPKAVNCGEKFFNYQAKFLLRIQQREREKPPGAIKN